MLRVTRVLAYLLESLGLRMLTAKTFLLTTTIRRELLSHVPAERLVDENLMGYLRVALAT
jgi:hypothetical protein